MSHPSLTALLNSIERTERKRFTHAELARALNVSEQVITNWAKRGISVEGALAAQFVFQKDANFILGKISHPMLLPRAQVEQESSAWLVREPNVAYFPEPNAEPLTTELLELFGKLDSEGKKEWLADLRGFVRGRRPHEVGDAPKVAEQ